VGWAGRIGGVDDPDGGPDAPLYRILDALAEVSRAPGRDYTAFSVRGSRFGYHWPRTRTVGLKQTLSEQRALVAERPEVFEVQFTTGAYGWVVVQLGLVEPDELCELVYEAWRLSAPDDLARAHPLPRIGRR
jgi:hypothetical protein